MARYSNRQYRIQILLLMAVYVVLMLFVWPAAKHAESPALKTLLALIPTLPVVLVIWLMAKRMMASDELEQRLHLIALSVATGVVAVASLIGGFLAAAHVIEIDGDILIWIFPVLCLTYSFTRLLIGRRYGVVSCE
jgi:hypothetical protein